MDEVASGSAFRKREGLVQCLSKSGMDGAEMINHVREDKEGKCRTPSFAKKCVLALIVNDNIHKEVVARGGNHRPRKYICS